MITDKIIEMCSKEHHWSPAYALSDSINSFNFQRWK